MADAQTYAEQVRLGAVLSRENLARFIEEQEAECDRLREFAEEVVRREGFNFTSGDYAALAREALGPNAGGEASR